MAEEKKGRPRISTENNPPLIELNAQTREERDLAFAKQEAVRKAVEKATATALKKKEPKK